MLPFSLYTKREIAKQLNGAGARFIEVFEMEMKTISGLLKEKGKDGL